MARRLAVSGGRHNPARRESRHFQTIRVAASGAGQRVTDDAIGAKRLSKSVRSGTCRTGRPSRRVTTSARSASTAVIAAGPMYGIVVRDERLMHGYSDIPERSLEQVAHHAGSKLTVFERIGEMIGIFSHTEVGSGGNWVEALCMEVRNLHGIARLSQFARDHIVRRGDERIRLRMGVDNQSVVDRAALSAGVSAVP